MLEAIGLLAPPLVSLGIYNHLRRGQLGVRNLMFAYAAFLIVINLALYVITLYLFKHPEVVFTGSYFVKYIAAGSLLAVVSAFGFNLLQNSVSVTVKRDEP